MNRPYNQEAFTPEEVEAGLAAEFIKFLIDQDQKALKIKFKDGGVTSFKNINITSDGYCLLVQWTDVFDDEDNEHNQFVYVDDDERIMKVLDLPDNSTVYCLDDDDRKQTLEDWLKENPGWEKDQYGRWYNKKEQEDFIKSLEKNKEN